MANVVTSVCYIVFFFLVKALFTRSRSVDVKEQVIRKTLINIFYTCYAPGKLVKLVKMSDETNFAQNT